MANVEANPMTQLERKMQRKGKLLEQRCLLQGMVETWEEEDHKKEYNAERKAYIRHLKERLYAVENRIKVMSI
jgi:hypothetical protein